MSRAVGYTAITILLAGAAAHAQMNDLASFGGASWEGIHIYGVNAYASYVSSVYPINTTVGGPVNQFGSNVSYGASTSVGWQYHRGEKLGFSMFGTGSYNRSQNYNSLSAFGGSLMTNLTLQFTPKFSVSISANGLYQTMADYLFQPSGLGVVAQTPATVYDLAAGMGVGQFGTAPGQTPVTGPTASAPTPASNPATSLLFGSRVLTYAALASASYQATSRLTFTFAGVTAAGQNRFGGDSGIPVQTQTVPRTIGLIGSASMDYSLTPRTGMGVSVSGARNSNVYQNAYTADVQLSLRRMMGMHWFMAGSGGYAYSVSVAQQYGIPKTRQWIGSGSLGYRLQSQTFAVSVHRSSMEADGFAVGTNTSITGAWSWSPRGGRWALMASGGEQKLDNTGFANLSGWHASGGWRMRLPENLSLSAQYTYASNTGTLSGEVFNASVNSVRVTIGWTPAALEAAIEAAARH